MRKTALSLGVILILAACGSGAADTTTTTTTTTLATTTTTTPATTTTTAATTTTALDPEWWSTDEIRGYRWDERFSAKRDDTLAFKTTGFFVLELSRLGGLGVIFRSDDDRATWVSKLTQNPYLVASDVTEGVIDGKAMTKLWYELPPNSGAPEQAGCPGPCVALFDTAGYGWVQIEGPASPAWIIERDGGTFAVFAEVISGDIEEWVAYLEEWLNSIEWG